MYYVVHHVLVSSGDVLVCKLVVDEVVSDHTT